MIVTDSSIFHEIGRVAELEGFPYSQVGVDNDGAVVSLRVCWTRVALISDWALGARSDRSRHVQLPGAIALVASRSAQGHVACR